MTKYFVIRMQRSIHLLAPVMRASPRHNQIVLLVRDKLTVEPLRQELRTHGFAAISVSEPAAAIDAICLRPPDLVLLDWSLPERVREVVHGEKARHGFALIVLSAAGRESGLNSFPDFGADDCVSPPLAVRETALRMQELLHRRESQSGPMLVCDDLRIDLATRQVIARGRRLPMSDVQLRLLIFFVQHQGRLCRRELLLKEVWDAAHQPASRTVDVNVQRLRQLLRTAGCHHYIETIRGSGYRFTPAGRIGLLHPS